MRLSVSLRIFNAIILSNIYTVSFYGGLAIKEYYLSKELDKVDDSRPPPHERAVRARIVQCVSTFRLFLAKNRPHSWSKGWSKNAKSF